MQFYTINLKTHSQHTVKIGSELANRIAAKNAKCVKIGNDKHKVFTSIESAKAYSAILLLIGGAE